MWYLGRRHAIAHAEYVINNMQEMYSLQRVLNDLPYCDNCSVSRESDQIHETGQFITNLLLLHPLGKREIESIDHHARVDVLARASILQAG